ncbi:hypothetical protein [Stenotrophomonas maltophilia]|uniref:hypothetical protein n=1 Tax=Stenotrophomonas maltophilia TaxID=40324 RepID=UPI00201CE952|nr:hypothetical protein [Stenotrophomonas maltophilia]UQY97337.1 hypothetical protein LZ605_08245 [Stenotrophomonas maltophilia]
MKKRDYEQITDVANIVKDARGKFIFGVETKTGGWLAGPFDTLLEAELEHEACLEAASRKT